MNGSAMIAESDNRPVHLCPACLQKLQWHLGFDLSMRYRALSSAYAKMGWRDAAAFAAQMAESAVVGGFPREHDLSAMAGESP
jgi:hypothetical protein